jgi:flagellar P-ring protein precursor FlgI
MNLRVIRLMLCIACFVVSSLPCRAEVRIKDITSVDGMRSNSLYGTGLVVGLNGTGGRSLSTQQMAIDMLRKLEMTTKLARQSLLDNVFKSNNIAHVMVTAELPAFARKGSKLDVIVSVLDDATNLEGGTLILTTLRGADGEVYATAQGQLSIGGFRVPSTVQGTQKNHPTVARGQNAGIVEREVLSQIDNGGVIRLALRDADFTTAKTIMLAINKQYPAVAKTIDPATIQIRVPMQRRDDLPDFVSEIGQINIIPDTAAKVVINERTGTVIVGHNVRISSVMIAHGNLSIKPNVTFIPSDASKALPPAELNPPPPNESDDPVDKILESLRQPRPLPGAEAPVAVHDVEQTFTVAELARVLNALGVTPRDLISIFQALRESGALHADIVFN